MSDPDVLRIIEAAQRAEPRVAPDKIRRIVDAAMDTLDDLISEARVKGNEEWPDEGDLFVLFEH